MWRLEEEELLIEVWADKIFQLRGQRKNSHIYKEMAEVVKGHSPEEIKIKIHNLTNRYNKEKKLMGPSGGTPSEWIFFTKIHAILGSLPIHNVSDLVEESVGGLPFSQTLTIEDADIDDVKEIVLSMSNDPGPSSRVSIPSPAKKKRNISKTDKELNKLESIIEENLKMIQQNDEQILEVERQRNTILERLAASCETIQKEIVSLLKPN